MVQESQEKVWLTQTLQAHFSIDKSIQFSYIPNVKKTITRYGEGSRKMANYASAVRRIRRSEKSRQRNRHYRSAMKTSIKQMLACENKEDAEKQFTRTQSLLDKLASKGIIHKNKAANQKARLALFVNSFSS